MKIKLLTVLGVVGFSIQVCAAVTNFLYVATTGSNDNDGLTPENPKKTIAAAVSAFDPDAADYCVISVAAGEYTEDLVNGGSCVVLDKPMAVVGATGNPADVMVGTTVPAKSSGRIFSLNHSEARLRYLTVRGGLSPAVNNKADGSGVLIDTQGGIIEDCVFTGGGNSAWNSRGNAVSAFAGRVSRCVVTGITVTPANGMFFGNGSAVFDNCLLYGNTTGGGYAVWLEGSAVAANCTVADNIGTSGSGIKINYKDATAVNCAIFGNVAPDNAYGSVWGNSYGKRYFGCAADKVISSGVGCVCGEALFKDSANRNYRLTPASCCLDAGTDPSSYAAYDKDLDGLTRVVGAIDIGCYENQKADFECSFTSTLPGKLIPVTAHFEAKVIGAPGAFTGTWNFGDGTSESLDVGSMTANHEYTVAGVYTVKLTVTSGTSVSYERKALVNVAPGTMYVLYQNADAQYPYDAVTNAAPTLADAVAAAVDGVTIFVLPGEGGVLTQTVAVTLDKAVRVLGSTGDPDDVTFENTKMNEDGHGLFVLNHPQAFLANVTLKNASLRANNSRGSAIRIKANGGTVSNCVVNSAQAQHFSSYGAGAYLEAGLVTHSRFTGTFTSCPAYNQDPSGAGVVVHVEKGSMENCLFENIELKPSTISDGTTCGPVISANAGSILNCTINGKCKCVPGGTSKEAKWNLYDGGSGIYGTSSSVIKNCVVVNVTNATDVVTPFTGTAARFSNCAGDGETVWGGTGCVKGTADQFFANAAAGNYLPKVKGPLVDAGAAVSLCSSVDFAGNQRVFGTAIDIGAYELNEVASKDGLQILLR